MTCRWMVMWGPSNEAPWRTWFSDVAHHAVFVYRGSSCSFVLKTIKLFSPRKTNRFLFFIEEKIFYFFCIMLKK